jgi:tetratricopeptide (TPR) repeat protein
MQQQFYLLFLKMVPFLFLINFLSGGENLFYHPQSPIFISADGINASAISAKVKEHQNSFFTISDIDMLDATSKECQRNISTNISVINANITSTVIDRQRLLQLPNLDAINKEIELKISSNKQVHKEMQQDLSNISYKALYLVIIDNIDLYASKDDLNKLSESIITPDAIKSLNGLFIENTTIVKNNMLVQDYIRSSITGELNIEQVYIANTWREDRRHVFLAKVSVTPLKSKPTRSSSLLTTSNRYSLINLARLPKYKNIIQGKPLSDQICFQIDNGLHSIIEAISEENNSAQKHEKFILSSAELAITKIDNDIRELQSEYSTSKEAIFETTQSITNLKCHDTPENCLRITLKYLENKIQQYENAKQNIKEQEIITQRSTVILEGEPTTDIANTVMRVCNQMRSSYGNMEKYYELTEVENHMLTSFNTNQQRQVYRELDTIWIYPVPGDADKFYVSVAAKFKILSKDKCFSEVIGNNDLKSYSNAEKVKSKIRILECQINNNHLGISLSDADYDALIMKRDYERAINIIEETYPPKSRNADVWQKLAYASQFVNKHEKAIACYNISLNFEPNCIFSLYQLAKIYFAQNNYDLASNQIDKAFSILGVVLN